MTPELIQHSIIIQTRMGWSIPNAIRQERPPVALQASRELFAELRPGARLRSLTATYNCIGMVVACRRTWVDTEHLLRVLREDGYRRLSGESQVEQGDVVVYRDDSGDVSHVGIVLRKKLYNPNQPGDTLVVVSKWGADGEYEHDVNDVPPLLGHPAEYWTDRKE